MIEKEFNIQEVKGYTIMSNYHLMDKALSLKAKGLLSMMFSKSDNWNYSMNGLVAICKEGETAVKSALKELRERRYVIITKYKSKENGQFKYRYDVYRTPQPVKENPVKHSPDIENLPMENHPLYKKTDVLNTDNKITDVLNTDNKNTPTELNCSYYNPPTESCNKLNPCNFAHKKDCEQKITSYSKGENQKNQDTEKWVITQAHIISVSEEMGFGDEEHITNSTETIKYYYQKYKEYMGKNHPRLNRACLKTVLEKFYRPKTQYFQMSDFESYKCLIDEYFGTVFREECDRNILHFMSDDVRDIIFARLTM